jgi:cysteine desulfurase
MVEYPIYLDAQASSRIASEVQQAVLEYWSEGNGNPHSPHEHGRRAKEQITLSLREIADFIGCLPRELTLVSGATAANNLAIKGIEPLKGKGRDRILVSAIEHPCIMEAAFFMAANRGFNVEVVPVDAEGFVDPKIIEEMLDERVAVVSIMLGNNEIGTLQDIATLSNLIQSVGGLLHVDATQASGRTPIDVLDLNCDLLSISAHKIAGPIGIGALFVREGIELLPMIHGGGQQPLASGTMSPELCVGFSTACSLAEIWLEESEVRRQRALMEKFEAGLSAAGYDILKNGPVDDSHRLVGTTHITFKNVDLQDLQAWISPFVSFSTKSACASEKTSISHVLSAIGLSEAEANNSARFSISYLTSEEDITNAIEYFSEYLSSQISRITA